MSADICHICVHNLLRNNFKAIWELVSISQRPSGFWQIKLVHNTSGRAGTIYACHDKALEWYRTEVLFAQLKASGNSLPQ